MQNRFPAIEDIEYEEIYGKKRPESRPCDTKSTFNLKKEVEGVYQRVDNIAVLSNEISRNEIIGGMKNIPNYIQQRNRIINIYKDNGIVKYADCGDMEINHFVKMKLFLEKSGLINHKIDLKVHYLETKDFLQKIKDDKDSKEEQLDKFLKMIQKTFFPQEFEYNTFDAKKCINQEENNCESDNLFFNLKDSTIVCLNCKQKGFFPDIITYSDFMPVNDYKKSLKLDDLEVLRAVYKYQDDWNKISTELDTSKAECVLRFLKMDLSTQFQNINVPIFDNSKNRIMSVVSFLCSIIEPKLASQFARDIIQNYGKGKSENELIKDAFVQLKSSSAELVTLEFDKAKRIIEVILESQMKKMQLKEDAIHDLIKQSKGERQELSRLRNVYRNEFEELKKENKV